METNNPNLTQSYGSASKKRFRGDSDSSTISERFENPKESFTSKDSLIRKAKKSVGRFLYEFGIDFSAVQSPNFQTMISPISGIVKDQIPTFRELKGWIFEEELKEMHEYVDKIRNSWAETGCSLLLDGWTDAKGRSLINFLADCPRGTIYLRSYDTSGCLADMDAMFLLIDQAIIDVGVENVVQIITYSTSNFMKELGQRLMKKYRPIFWTVSGSFCIDLMLEKIGEMDLVKDTLDKAKIIAKFIHNHLEVLKILQDHTDGCELMKPSKIRSALPFLTLENIVSEEKSLKKMFLSSDSESSILTSRTEGKKVAEIVGSRSFWSAATTVLTAAFPLVRVMEWMNENKAQMGYIYEIIDQAKEAIKEGFENRESKYKPFWDAIDDVWNAHLYSPLHSAGYFLNPSLFYSTDAHIDAEVFTDLFCYIVRASKDHHVVDVITQELKEYPKAKGAFGLGCTLDATSDIAPALWWSKYGVECPELQRLAVRILNQTCEGASRFQLKRSLVEALLPSGRNQIEDQRSSDMAFLHCNLQLQSLVPHEFDPMEDWI